MFKQLAKLRKLTDVKRTGVLKAIFGDDAETLQVVNALIDKGKDGYDQIQQKMNKQASLNKRVQAQLGTLLQPVGGNDGDRKLTVLQLLAAHFLVTLKYHAMAGGVGGKNSRALRTKIPGLFAASSGLLPVLRF